MIQIEELKIFVALLCSDNVCLFILLIMVFLGHPPVLSLSSLICQPWTLDDWSASADPRRVDSSLIGIPFSQDAAQQVEQQNAQEAATRDLSENIRKIYMVTDM